MRVTELFTENLRQPIGLGERVPHLSYTLQSERVGDRQTACRILAASSAALLEEGKADLWDSGKMETGKWEKLVWQGALLCSRQEVYWKVRVWDAWGEASEWSRTGFFEMGLLEEKDWEAVWIGPGDGSVEGGVAESAVPALTGGFAVDVGKRLKKARLYIGSPGLVVVSVNGKQVTENLFEPGEKEGSYCACYVTYDIMPFLRNGKNRIGVLLGNGRNMDFSAETAKKRLLVQTELAYEDGTMETAVSDGSWKVGESAVIFQDWYEGETFDACRALQRRGWDIPETEESGLKNAVPVKPPAAGLTAGNRSPVRMTETGKARSVTALPRGRWLVDFGKSCTGFVLLKLTHSERYVGMKIEMYPAETLKADGSGVDQPACVAGRGEGNEGEGGEQPSRRTVTSYVVAGTGEEQWHPCFCCHSFRYVEVSGFPGIPLPENFVSCEVRRE